MMVGLGRVAVLLVTGALLLGGCDRITNSPHASGAEKTNTFFTAFQERSPSYLDPTASYSLNETPYTYQIYEPLYGYHYLKRPYELAPRRRRGDRQPRYYDKDGRELPDDAPGPRSPRASTTSSSDPGILYPPHPAFAKDAAGNFRYHALTREQLGDKRTPFDFEHRGTRELTADDFVYAIKRHATTRIKTPSFSPIFAEYVLGLKDYGELIKRRKTRSCRTAAADRPRQALPRLPPVGRWRAPRRPTITRCASASRASTRSGTTG